MTTKQKSYDEIIAEEAFERAARATRVRENYEKAEQKKIDEIDRKIKRMAAIVGCSKSEALELLTLLRSIW